MKTFDELLRMIHNETQVLVVPHRHPDGDALGAAFGLQGLLQANTGAHTKVVGAHTAWSSWMGSFERVHDNEWATSIVIVVDTAKKELLYSEKALEGKRVLLIDHHPEEPVFYDHAWIDETATSTCEIITRLADKASLSLDQKTANLLLFGILSDTTVLQHPYTSRATFRALDYLIAEGATYKALVNQLTKRPFSVTRALHQVSQSIQLTPHGLAYWLIDYSTMEQASFSFNDMFAELRSIEEARIIALLVRFEEESVLHVQSDAYDLQKVLAPFGGGGHKFASKVRGTDAALFTVIEAVDAMLRVEKNTIER